MFVDMDKSLSIILFFTFAAFGTVNAEEQLRVPCIEDGKFYRNPNQLPDRVWYTSECSKYYLCLGNEVFEFKCSTGLLFDVSRQICDFKVNVANCDVAKEYRSPKPLLHAANCGGFFELGCADGTCLPAEYFCDGHFDCPDSSDEEWCDPHNDPNAAPSCDIRQCHLPDCFCSQDGTLIPGNLPPNQVPQMILLTFDDAVNAENWEIFTDLIFSPDKVNPNGCPIKGTFYVSHQFTDYHKIQQLIDHGHEIAVHSVTGPEDWWTANATIEDWFDEMVGQANIINRFAGGRMENIRGMRAPFFKLGGNRQFLMMQEFGFIYDSSMVAPFSSTPLWPYTLDYKMPHQCHGINQRCPSRSYPGIWEMVVNQLEVGDYHCAMVDSCPSNLSGQDIYELLHNNFLRHFTSNRSPMGLHFHSTWFKRPDYRRAFKKFIMDTMQNPEVWFVTNWQAIQWMRHPVPLDQLVNYEPWSCNTKLEDKACDQPNICNVTSRVLQGTRTIQTCFDCPDQYPWIRNEFGQY